MVKLSRGAKHQTVKKYTEIAVGDEDASSKAVILKRYKIYAALTGKKKKRLTLLIDPDSDSVLL